MGAQGVASASGTERFRQRFTSCHPSHFRLLQDLWVSSLGLGTYLGDADDATDQLYHHAIRTALSNGCNLFDTAINYRCQRSERTLGTVLAACFHEQAMAREEIVLCTKGGYLPFDREVPADPTRYLTETIITPGLASYDEIVGGCHCLAPRYLDHSLNTSLSNLRVETIDLYYLHNPEQQLEQLTHDEFLGRLEAAFTLLEERVRDGRIRYYGIATWSGLRANPKARGYLALEPLVQLAEHVAGSAHHFRVVQLPYNLAMPEAYAFKNQSVAGQSMTALEAAGQLGLSVVISASLLQSRLIQLPAGLETRIPGTFTNPQRALQFVRSTPGVTSALVGMKQSVHVEENLALVQHPLMSPEEIHHLFDRGKR